MNGRPVVFLGPSLPIARAREILDADYYPPVRQGDVYRLSLARLPSAVGIVDGVFQDEPTVRHREILWLMAKGVPVFGAASMGALRAAELADMGMIGIGLVYRWYRRFPLAADDAVAVTHAPPELGNRPLSTSLIDLRRSIASAKRAAAVSAQEAATMARNARALPFARRSFEAMCQNADQAARLCLFRVEQKAGDAISMLRAMAAHALGDNWPTPTTESPPLVDAWLDDLADSGLPFDN